MSNCTSGCPTQDHESWGACARAKHLHVEGCADWKGLDRTKQKKWDRELDAYQSAKSDGIQPDGTSMTEIRKARDITEKTGVAYDQMKLSRTDPRTLK